MERGEIVEKQARQLARKIFVLGSYRLEVVDLQRKLEGDGFIPKGKRNRMMEKLEHLKAYLIPMMERRIDTIQGEIELC